MMCICSDCTRCIQTPFARVVAVDTKEHTLDDAAFADAQSFMIETKANEETLRKLTEYIKTAEKSAESRGPEQEVKRLYDN